MSEEKVSQEKDMIIAAHAKGGSAVLKTYMKLSGPGWLQSAITLGGGSLASALFLGVIGGVQLLWVQLFAMIMGVIMLSAISYVTLSTESSPFKAMRDKVNPVLAWGWLLASLMANMIWVLPQYSLAYSSITKNLLPGLFTDPDSIGSKMIVTLVLFVIASFITLSYGKKGKGMVIYEWTLKIIVALIVLCFMIVAGKLIMGDFGISFGDVLSGFVPSLDFMKQPIGDLKTAVDAIQDAGAREYWTNSIIGTQIEIMVSAAATAVGINMTFLLPFSMLNKGWGKEHRGLAIFDLSTGMVIPYVLATACVAICAAATFHAKPFEGLTVEKDGKVEIVQSHARAKDVDGILAKRSEKVTGEVSDKEKLVAAMLVKRDTSEFPLALAAVVGPKAANYIFGFGVLAMVFSTISMLMLISGFVVCEMFNLEHGGTAHKVGTFCATTGIFWPFIWGGGSGTYLAIVTSTFGYILLPIAFLAFLMMMNSRKVLGENIPKGRSRLIWNVLAGAAFLITAYAAGSTAWTKNMTIGGESVPFGRYFLIGFIVLVILGQVYVMMKNKRNSSAGE
jgi:Mn2+/Fe2+ NRAMP family transporter